MMKISTPHIMSEALRILWDANPNIVLEFIPLKKNLLQWPPAEIVYRYPWETKPTSEKDFYLQVTRKVSGGGFIGYSELVMVLFYGKNINYRRQYPLREYLYEEVLRLPTWGKEQLEEPTEEMLYPVQSIIASHT
jgi:hypothetical protein